MSYLLKYTIVGTVCFTIMHNLKLSLLCTHLYTSHSFFLNRKKNTKLLLIERFFLLCLKMLKFSVVQSSELHGIFQNFPSICSHVKMRSSYLLLCLQELSICCMRKQWWKWCEQEYTPNCFCPLDSSPSYREAKLLLLCFSQTL